jgi:hypothetical protein
MVHANSTNQTSANSVRDDAVRLSFIGGTAQPDGLSLIPRTKGIRRLGISISTFEDWSNKRSPRFKADLPRLYSWPGVSRSKFFRSDELDKYIRLLTGQNT